MSLIGSSTDKFKGNVLWNSNHDYMWPESLQTSCPFPKVTVSIHTQCPLIN